MDIPLEQSLASAVRYVLAEDIEETKAYFDEIPEKFYVPSVYFPVPRVEGQQVSFDSYRNIITVEAWFMDRTDWEAQTRAAAVRDALMLDRLAIPVYDGDGRETGKHIRTREPSHKRIDEGIVSLTFPLLDYFRRDDETVKAEHFIYVWKEIAQAYGEG